MARRAKKNAAQHRVSAVVCARWENPYIQEWLIFHRAIGIDHVYLYCNDDDPLGLYQQVLPFVGSDAPFVTFHHYPYKGQQFFMYTHFLQQHLRESEWFVFLDVDEFLRLPGHDMQAFLDRVPPEWDAVYFNWLFFGNNGFLTRPDGSVLLNYTKRASQLHVSTKTLTRAARVQPDKIVPRRQIWHHWFDSLGADAGLFNVVGHPMQSYFAETGSEDAYLADPALHPKLIAAGCIHHYAFKSERDFLLRYRRGTAGDFSGQAGWKNVYDRGEAPAFLARLGQETDTTLADMWLRILGRANESRIIRPPTLPNLALGRPATQSSMCEFSRGKTIAEDAAGAVNGEPSGTYQFHTDREREPWWQVDLGSQTEIGEIRVYNRMENAGLAERNRDIAVLLSEDGQNWREIFRREGPPGYGGVDGHPLRVPIKNESHARYVRVMLLNEGWLHLDQVEVYGRRPEP